MDYRLTDYSFELPEARIAQKPAANREQSRLLVAEGKTGIKDCVFRDLKNFLIPGDCLVLNQTRVMNARCYAEKENGLGIEVFILDILTADTRIPVLLKPSRRVKEGSPLFFRASGVTAVLVEKGEFGRGFMAFPTREALFSVLEKDGQIPLPPYIKREKGPTREDQNRYQTVFARDYGAVAAPTAGLHFSDSLLQDLQASGIQLCKITHHVGIGTFRPINVEDVRQHKMDAEQFVMEESTADRLNQAKQQGQRIIAVGTTSTRCLESCFSRGIFHAGKAETDLYIYPPYQFKAIDGLITNFHLPGSTLMLLVSALMGRERILDIYKHALRGDYRFYSYGDAMLLIPSF